MIDWWKYVLCVSTNRGQFIVKLFQVKWVPFAAGRKGMFWFRVFGYGLHVKDTRHWPLAFSERNGYTKHLHIGPLSIKALKP